MMADVIFNLNVSKSEISSVCLTAPNDKLPVLAALPFATSGEAQEPSFLLLLVWSLALKCKFVQYTCWHDVAELGFLIREAFSKFLILGLMEYITLLTAKLRLKVVLKHPHFW